MNRITKIREEIGEKQVDLTFYGRFCSLIEGDRKIILRAIKNGRKKGVIGAIQPGRHDRIWTTWSIAFDDLKVGDTVEFGGLLGYAPVMPVNSFGCGDFVNRIGRIPAPIHSFKN